MTFKFSKRQPVQSQFFKMMKTLSHKQLAKVINKKIWIIQSLSQADTTGFFFPLL